MMIFCSLLQFSMMEFGSWEIKFSLKVFRWILMTYFPKSWHGWLSIRCQGVLQVALKYPWLWPSCGPLHSGFWLKSILTLPLDLCSHPLLRWRETGEGSWYLLALKEWITPFLSRLRLKLLNGLCFCQQDWWLILFIFRLILIFIRVQLDPSWPHLGELDLRFWYAEFAVFPL